MGKNPIPRGSGWRAGDARRIKAVSSMARILYRHRATDRPIFALAFVDERNTSRVFCGPAAEYFLFRALRDKSRRELRWLQCNGRRLSPRSLAAVNVFIRSGAAQRFRFRLSRYGKEQISWVRFCSLLALTLEPSGVKIAA